MGGLTGNEEIAAALRSAGLDARPMDGWVYVQIGDRVLYIGAEYGASLECAWYSPEAEWWKGS